jgi:sigma-B regulation protein RsbU (phosphoserine phosphatase)
MRNLLAYFERVFDPDYSVGGARLGDLFEEVLDRVAVHEMPEFGTGGDSGAVASKSERFVRFFYRPHLFPGMDDDLRRAHQLQFHLLPRGLPEGSPVAVAAVLESYCHLSGDLFGWEMLRDGRFLVWMVDVSGHGVRSGLCAAVVSILIDRARERGRVAHLVAELNRSLEACTRDRHAPLHATGFFLALGADGDGTYCSAGHPPVVLRRNEGALELLKPLGIPIGLLPDQACGSRELRLEAGDSLLLYTDGLVETKSRDGDEFGLERLQRLFTEPTETPEEMTGAIYNEIATRQDLRRLEDDVTFLVARFD